MGPRWDGDNPALQPVSTRALGNAHPFCVGGTPCCMYQVVKASPNRVHILEWAGGLFAADLVPRLISYHKAQGRTIAIRRLKLPERSRVEIEWKLEQCVYHLFREKAGTNVTIPVNQLVRHPLIASSVAAHCSVSSLCPL